jgi:VIT1/CCC1 family predicted Fe2+/Mn2+ transporter
LAGERRPRAYDARGEALHIGATAATSGAVSDEDRSYMVNLVAGNAGVTTDEAQRRVDAFIQSVKDARDHAKTAADEARKAATSAALYTALALIIGAFIASVSGAIGGRLRDQHL